MVLKWLDVVRMTKGKTLMRAGRTSIAPEFVFRLSACNGGDETEKTPLLILKSLWVFS